MNLGSNQLIFYFSVFQLFSAFVSIFDGEYLSSANRKAHDCILPIFIFVSVKFEIILSTGAMRKSLMSTRKKICLLLSYGIWFRMLFRREVIGDPW